MATNITILKCFNDYVFTNFNKEFIVKEFFNDIKMSKYIFKKSFKNKDCFLNGYFTYFYNSLIYKDSENNLSINKLISLNHFIVKFYHFVIRFIRHNKELIKKCDKDIFRQNVKKYFFNLKNYLLKLYSSKYIKLDKTLVDAPLFIEISFSNIESIILYAKEEIDLIDIMDIKSTYRSVSSYINEIIKSTI